MKFTLNGNGFGSFFSAIGISLMVLLAPAVSFAYCSESTPAAQQRCLIQEAQEAAREQQQRAQQEAQERMREQQLQAQQEAQERMRQQQLQAQQEAQERMRQQQLQAQQEAQERMRQQQLQAQQQAQERARQQQLQSEQAGAERARQLQDSGRSDSPQLRQPQTQDRSRSDYSMPGPSSTAKETGHASPNVGVPRALPNAPSAEHYRPTTEDQPSISRDARPSDIVQHSRVPLDANSIVEPRADRSGYIAARNQPNGIRLVVSEQKLGNGENRITAFEEKRLGGGNTTARLYTNGRLTAEGPHFRSAGLAGGPKFVKYGNGLHAAYLSTGQPLYTERFRSITRADGVARKTVVRTTFATVVSGGGASMRVPVVRIYPLYDTVNGIDFYVYQPALYPPLFYYQLYRSLAAAIVSGPGCAVCPPPTVAFEDPTQSYTDPMDLVGDMVVGDATMADTSPDYGDEATALAQRNPDDNGSDVEANLPPAPPEMLAAEAVFQGANGDSIDELRSSATELRRSVSQNAGPAIGQAAPASDWHEVSYVAGPGVNTADGASAALAVPEYVRTQLRKEVRLAIAMQQNRNTLFVLNIAASDYAKVFIFQAAAPIDVNEAGNNDQCTLSGGDLIRFARVPSTTDTVVQMKVISSRAGHCRQNQTVELGVSDLQDMLNAFSERVERDTTRLNACLSEGGACVKA